MPPITNVSFRRTVLKTIGGLALAFGILGGVSRVAMREATHHRQIEANCRGNICEVDLRSELDLKNNRPRFGIEKNCGAKLLGSRLLDEHLLRYRIDVANISPDNPCTIKLALGETIFTFPDALSR
jgi:hypothetical protein